MLNLKKKKFTSLTLLALLLASCRVFSFQFGEYTHLKLAEELTRQQKYEQAIDEYRRHIEFRLKQEDRPEWENPNFYLLMIGDLYLNQGKVNEALESYEQAEKEGVDKGLVSDRYRYAAKWYEGKGQLKAAFDVLVKYRERDVLLFDTMLDRISKEIVRLEESGKDKPKP